MSLEDTTVAFIIGMQIILMTLIIMMIFSKCDFGTINHYDGHSHDDQGDDDDQGDHDDDDDNYLEVNEVFPPRL